MSIKRSKNGQTEKAAVIDDMPEQTKEKQPPLPEESPKPTYAKGDVFYLRNGCKAAVMGKQSKKVQYTVFGHGGKKSPKEVTQKVFEELLSSGHFKMENDV